MIDIDKLITDAIKNKNILKANLYRMVKSKIEKELQSKGRKSKVMSVDDVMAALKKEYKEIREEIEFIDPVKNNAGYKALCAKLSYLDELLPKIHPIEDAIELIKKSIQETHDINMGQIMKKIKDSGKNFDMKEVSKKVKEMLK